MSETEVSDAVIIGVVSVCSRDASVLFNPGFVYSYVSTYFDTYLVAPRDSLSARVYVSTLVGDSIVVDHVYRSCVVIIGGLETPVDLLLLGMADFDVILGMDWLSTAEVHSMDSVLVFREFLEVYPVDLLGMPPDRDIDFCIDVAPCTQHISILPYRMALPELKELKEQLQDLLDEPLLDLVSLYGVRLCCLLRRRMGR
ncbi:uncharacterized protein [Nicotiana sylvestris]|uniref:uncharacterized protein n=1 Tax=Nicotiana sylvestris TaxID=4096 RepID=UPI00388CE1FA